MKTQNYTIPEIAKIVRVDIEDVQNAITTLGYKGKSFNLEQCGQISNILASIEPAKVSTKIKGTPKEVKAKINEKITKQAQNEVKKAEKEPFKYENTQNTQNTIVDDIYELCAFAYTKATIKHILQLLEVAVAERLCAGQSVRFMRFMSIKNRKNKGQSGHSFFGDFVYKHNTVNVKVSKGVR